jgi:hypothetical protein
LGGSASQISRARLALLTTTYQFQFLRNRARPGPRTNALFCWSDPPGELTYMDYMEWHIVLNSIQRVDEDPHVSRVALDDPERTETDIFQPSWTADAWLAHARHTEVQAVAPRVDLSTADESWAPSKRAAHALRELGFDPDRILVRRLHKAEA